MKSGLTLLIFSLIIVSCAQTKEKATDTTPRNQISVGDTVYLNSGVKYVFLKKGNASDSITPSSVVTTHIILKANGMEAWSTYNPLQPFTFVLNQVPMIAGFGEVIRYMRTGDQIMAVIPSELGYGTRGNGPNIPPNALLHFDIEVLRIQ